MTLLKSVFLLTTISTLFLFTSCKNINNKNNAAQEEKITPLDINVKYAPIPDDEKRHLTEIIEEFYNNILSKKLNGQVLVAKNGVILFEKYVGNERLYSYSSNPMNEHSSIHLASSSKPFTASAILMLHQQGKLTIDDLVLKYLPNFPYPTITIKMLLNHRSGILNYLNNLENWGWKTKQMASNEDLINMLINNKPILNFPPDTKFSYSNTNYVLLASIVEKVSGKRFQDFLQNNIFKPLQMHDTYVFAPKDTLTAIPSYNWHKRMYPFDNLDRTYGDKNIYSTVRDMFKWDQALYTDKILTEESKQIAYKGYSNEKPGIKNYGLGWRMFDFPNQKKIILHNGWWHGNNNAFIRLIQDSVVIICLGNVQTKTNYSVMQLSYLFGDYPFEYEVEEGKDTAKTNEMLMLQQLKLRADSLKNAQKILQQKNKKDSIPVPRKKDTIPNRKDSIINSNSKKISKLKDSI